MTVDECRLPEQKKHRLVKASVRGGASPTNDSDACEDGGRREDKPAADSNTVGALVFLHASKLRTVCKSFPAPLLPLSADSRTFAFSVPLGEKTKYVVEFRPIPSAGFLQTHRDFIAGVEHDDHPLAI